MDQVFRKLQGKVAVITGGSSGIGYATARLLHQHGASVAIVGRDANKLDAAALSIGPRAFGIQADVADIADIERVMQVVGERHGRIDILFANAGTSHCPPWEKTDSASFDAIIGLNFKGVFFTCARAVPLLADDASIVLTGSAAADMGRLGDPLYAATKAAVRSLARTLANDPTLLSKRVRINVLSPGATKTPLTQAAYEIPEVDSYVRDTIPLGRWATPDELARAALFLASSDSSYMTGSVLAVDGGMAQI
ncbi:MAG: SDR family oxidoreductase [Paraburkholderia sp.]|jgi:NAD(P)-dependent dehydrogenase (short-subunit alcohol dehydrogenase family)|uniref:SDR family NAD(P)-dependent oxidoreductase n=1 Tax=Burkholderiaceae TaxID=119060 RepID=UPI001485000E|nr:SDR family oxidoreductase [Burkholderia sp. 4M9327F10]